MLESGWQHRLSAHVFPPAHDEPPSTSSGGVEPLGLEGKVTDGVAGVGAGEMVLILLGRGVPLALGGKVSDFADGVGPGELVPMLGWGPPSLSGDGEGASVVSLVAEAGAGAGVEPGGGDGARVYSYSSFVDRCVPSHLHSSTEEEALRSESAFSLQSNLSTVGGTYTSSTHGSMPVSTMAATHGLTSYPDSSDATR